MPACRLAPDRVGCEGRVHRGAGQRGQRLVVPAVHLAHRGVLRRQRPPGLRGHVGGQGDHQARVPQRRQRVPGQGRHQPEGDVGGGAHLQRDAPVAQLGHQPGVLQRPDAVPDALGAADADRLPDAGRAGRLPGVVDEVQPGVGGVGHDRRRTAPAGGPRRRRSRRPTTPCARCRTASSTVRRKRSTERRRGWSRSTCTCSPVSARPMASPSSTASSGISGSPSRSPWLAAVNVTSA